MAFNPEKLEFFPVEPGVYLMKDRKGVVIYVGKAKALKTRIKSYFHGSSDERAMIPFLIRETCEIDTLIVRSEKEALLLENTLIKKHQPKYNACLKDDKSFITLTINPKEPWPKVSLLRYKGGPPENLLCFGPYTSAHAARATYDLLTRLFPLRQCSDEELKRRTRPCLLYAIKRCCAPCVGKCTPEEYQGHVKSTIRFLRGEDQTILKELYQEMQIASQEMAYEKAAEILKMIRHIEHVLDSDQIVYKTEGKDTDVLHFFREKNDVMLALLFFREGKLTGSEHFFFQNVLEDTEDLLTSFILQHYAKAVTFLPEEILVPMPLSASVSTILEERLSKKIPLSCPKQGTKKELLLLAEKNAKSQFFQEKQEKDSMEKRLLDLQEILKLSRYPERIECFDTSNTSGSQPVASMVAFCRGKPDRKRYRVYNLEKRGGPDDYAGIREVLTRRLKKALEEEDLPDLLIVDGGKGQLNVALDVLKELNIACIDLISLAKDKGRHDKGVTGEKIFLPGNHDPILLNPTSSLLFLLQQIRDEAHRKAITFHKLKRSKSTIKSALDDLPGIGAIKKRRLLSHFGSLEKIQEATDQDLLQVKGITQKDVNTLKKLDGRS